MVATAKGQPQLMINPMANKHNPVPGGAFNQHISRSVPQASALGWEGGSFPWGGFLGAAVWVLPRNPQSKHVRGSAQHSSCSTSPELVINDAWSGS